MNAWALEQLAEAQNNYSVFCISIQYSFEYLISLWTHTTRPQFENPVPAPELSFSAKPNPFKNGWKNHATMTILNTHIVPWLIAQFGLEYADWDNVDGLSKFVLRRAGNCVVPQFVNYEKPIWHAASTLRTGPRRPPPGCLELSDKAALQAQWTRRQYWDPGGW